MAILVWNPEWETGNAEIDGQHRMWMAQTEQLFQAVTHRERANIKATMAFLATYVDSHFGVEEAYMERYEYPGRAEHIALHDALRQRLGSMAKQVQREPSEATGEMAEFLSGWLLDHIDEQDRALACYLKKHLPHSAHA